MSLIWLYQFANRTHPLALPLVLALLVGGIFLLCYQTAGGLIRDITTPRQLIGMLLMYATLPAYLVAMIVYIWRRTERELQQLATTADVNLAPIRQRLTRLPPAGFALIAIGIAFSVQQNASLLFGEPANRSSLDWAFVGGNTLVWMLVAATISWRIPVSLAISQLGRTYPVELQALHRVRPFGRIATADVLLTMGAASFMALQSIDAEFRIVNYRDGSIVAVVSAVILFFLPLMGLRGNIQIRKAARVAELRVALEETPAADATTTELLWAHLERIKSLSVWPMDTSLLTRVLAYVVIPPLAWVGAALVEQLVDQLG